MWLELPTSHISPALTVDLALAFHVATLSVGFIARKCSTWQCYNCNIYTYHRAYQPICFCLSFFTHIFLIFF